MGDNVAGCTCTEMNHARSHSQPLPSSCSVIQVLYPPSYLGTPVPLPDPPPYSPQEESAASPPLTSSTATGPSPDPLAEDPSLTGVPSQPCRGVLPSPPFEDDLEEGEPLPAYSRFDQRRPRFPTASDILGPYPPMSVLRRAAH